MGAVPPFEFSGTYDAASLNAATRVLFRRLWLWQLPLTCGAVLVVLGTGLWLWWYLRMHGLAWFCFAYPLLFPVLWMFSRWSIQQRLMKKLSKPVQVRMTEGDFSIASEGESHTYPWSRFRSTDNDDHNLYLFLTKRSALVVPTHGISSDALQFAVGRVGARGTAV